MSLQVIGAGTGRTGTSSLKIALEHLLGKPCYHMVELLQNPAHTPTWHDAAFGRMPNWGSFFAEYGAAVDWPSAAFWPELIEAFPDALVILSVRDGAAWRESARRTIYAPHEPKSIMWQEMIEQIGATRFPVHNVIHTDAQASIDLFNTWNARVKAGVSAERLLVWEAKEGWDPICNALNLPIPDLPFPRANTLADWQARLRAQGIEPAS